MEKTLGQKIRLRMLHCNMTQEDLERKTGITQGFISMIIRDVKKPGFDNLKRLADALGVDVNFFYE